MSNHVEYRRFPRGQKCDYEGCGSRRFYIEDGRQFCRNGHEQQGFSQVHADEDDFNTQGRKTRLKRKEKERIERHFSGRYAIELFLQCYQLVLWKQVSWLVKKKGFPTELETIVRDLWAVRLRAVNGLGEENGGSTSEAMTGFSSTDEGRGVESDATEGTQGLEMEKRKRKAARHRGLPKLIDSLGLCYLGTMLLRLPISLGQMHRWAEREEIVYIRAIREVPKEMRARLPSYYHLALDTGSPLKRGDLHKSVLELVITFKQQFNIIFPPLNEPLILFKHVRNLCLPVDIYAAVQRMAKVLKIDFSFPDTLGRHRVTAYPESQIVSLVVIATKLSHPFDDIVRTANNITDPSALVIDWEMWRSIMDEAPQDGLKCGEELRINDEDVLRMDTKQLDSYFDWYQNTWIDDRDAKMPEQILDLFPLTNVPPKDEHEVIWSDDEVAAERVINMHANLIWHGPIDAADEDEGSPINRPGSYYRYYRSEQDLPEKAKAFYEKAAENAGLSLDMLCRAVYLTERRLQVFIMAERRKRAEEQYRQRATEERANEE